MSSQQSTADYILDQIGGGGRVAIRKMFGEFGVFCDGRMVGVICDDRLFVKPTRAGRAFLGEVEEVSPFPRAKPYFLIAEERWDDADFMREVIRVTAAEVPPPKEKKRQARR
jgi:TfoX/Sxy family transcriptional regulator of competence genes